MALVAESTLTAATLTVAFHRIVESVPFFTANTSCFPFESKKCSEIVFSSCTEAKNAGYEVAEI